MLRYYYRAVKDKSELVTGYIEAKDPNEAKEKVRQMGFTPAGIYEEKLIPKEYAPQKDKQVKKFKLTDLMYFTSELHMLTDSGISVLDALDSIKQQAPSIRVAAFARDLEKSIKNGSTLYEALLPYEDVIGNIYTSLCKTGEESGALPTTLDYLTNLLKKKNNLKGKFIHMSIYPAILTVTLIGIYFLFGAFIFPTLIMKMNVDNVPPLVNFFMFGTNFVFKTWWLFLLGGFGSWIILYQTIGIKTIKQKLGNFFARIPLMKECITYLSLSHYMAVLHVAYEAGVPIQNALDLAEDTISVEALRKQAKTVTLAAEKGKSLTDSFNNSGLIPPVMMSMISAGEKTGKLGQMFRDISIAVEQKLDNAISALSKAFEPLLLQVIGGGVALAAIAMIQMYASALSSII